MDEGFIASFHLFNVDLVSFPSWVPGLPVAEQSRSG